MDLSPGIVGAPFRAPHFEDVSFVIVIGLYNSQVKEPQAL